MAEVLSGSRGQTILIASNSYDRPVIEPVVTDLMNSGYNVVAYEADKVATAETPLDIRVDANGLVMHYDGEPIALAQVAAAWYRRPNMFGPLEEDKARQESVDGERRFLQRSIWAAIPESAWLNPPERMRSVEDKLGQLVLANTVGFAIPPTVVSNHWENITSLPSDKLILKMPYGILYVDNKLRTLYTTVLNNTGAAPVDGNPYPGIWQPYVTKAREWRITVVGQETFDAAIYTAPGAKDDWRKHQHGPDVEFRHEKFPDDAKAKCLQFLGSLGLRYGACDFIEKPDGEIVFLECNPNGQYLWVEQALGLPISKAIASELAATARAA